MLSDIDIFSARFATLPSLRNTASSHGLIHTETGEQQSWIRSCFYDPPHNPIKHNIKEIYPTGNLITDDDMAFHDKIRVLDLIKSCGKQKNIHKARQIHADVLKKRMIPKDVYIANALITTYAKCGALQEAREVFEQIPLRNIVSWNALISGYVQNGLSYEALRCFGQMKDAGIFPNAVTYTCILKACGIMGSLEIGEGIEADVREKKLLDRDVVLGTALVDMYCKCGALGKAQEVFGHLRDRNVVTWNALIGGYAQNGFAHEAFKYFRQMKDVGVCPNAVTYICIFKACSILGSLSVGEEIHGEVRKRGLVQKDVMLGNALVDMYSKCGVLEKALEVFEQLPLRTIVSWNALISGYIQNGLGDEALKCFKEMEDSGVSPNAVTYACILKACGIVGSLEIGKDIDVEVRKQGILEEDVVLGTAFMDMYAKCGVLEKVRGVFEQLPVRDVVAWNVLISGYAQLSQVNAALDLYSRMQAEDVVPNSATFVVLLNACCHAGLIKEGEKLFHEMHTIYVLTPTLEHYTCMIDLFGRVGNFDKLISLVKQVHHLRYLPLFHSILSSCRQWRNVILGRWAFEQTIQLDEKSAAAYVNMRNIYAASGMATEANRIEALRVEKTMSNKPRSWWTDANGNAHSFFVGKEGQPQCADIYAKMEEIHQKLAQEGYFRGLHCTTSDDKNEFVSCVLGVKMAIACVLINTPNGMSIHVTTNRGICDACHSFISLISMTEKRMIHVKDGNRIHSFENGNCICDDCK